MGIYTRFAAFCRDVDCFDTEAFRVTGSEAALLDPQVRALMEESAEAWAVAQPILHAVGTSLVGMYVGCMNQEYLDVMAQTLGSKLPPQVRSHARSSRTPTVGANASRFNTCFAGNCEQRAALHGWSAELQLWLHRYGRICKMSPPARAACHNAPPQPMAQAPASAPTRRAHRLWLPHTWPTVVCWMEKPTPRSWAGPT